MDADDVSPAVMDERLSLLTQVTKIGEDKFESLTADLWLPALGRSVFGGVLIAQSMEAAMQTVDPIFDLHEIHCKFLDGAKQEKIQFQVERQRDGRSYLTRSVRASQADHLIFVASVSFQRPEPRQPMYFAPPPVITAAGQFRLHTSIPDGFSNVPGEVLPPDLCPPGSSRFDGAIAMVGDNPEGFGFLQQFKNDQLWLPVEYRPAVPTMYDEFGRIQYGAQLAFWMRSRGSYEGSVNRQRAVLGFHVDQFMLSTMMASVPHGVPAMMASLDHTMWFHNAFDMSDWLLMVMENQANSNGRALILGRIYRSDGMLVAIVIQEGVVRYALDEEAPGDGRPNARSARARRKSKSHAAADGTGPIEDRHSHAGAPNAGQAKL
ncbi:palmitoyl-CoA hydrolase [Malassezia sp. CBS 17886]|nr:palmitoyl-CoA hydrolase [Malassezia sp. CBS 17886]